MSLVFTLDQRVRVTSTTGRDTAKKKSFLTLGSKEMEIKPERIEPMILRILQISKQLSSSKP